MKREATRHVPVVVFLAVAAWFAGEATVAAQTRHAVTLISQTGKARVANIAFSPTGEWLASADAAGTRLWHVKRQRQLRWFRQPSRPSALAFSPDGKTLFTGHDDGTISFWNPATGEELRRVQRESPDRNDSIHFLLISADGRQLVALSRLASTIRILDARDGQLRRRVQMQYALDFTAVHFSSREGRVLGVDQLGITEWDLMTGRETGRWSDANSGSLRRAAISDDGTMAVTEPEYGSYLMFWNLTTGSSRQLPNQIRAGGRGVGFLPGSHRLWLLSNDGVITTTDGTPQNTAFIRPRTDALPYARTDSAAVSPSGQLVALVEEDRVHLVDMAAAKSLGVLEAKGSRASTAAFVPDGRHLAVASGKGITLWDLEAGRPASRIDTADEIEFLTFSSTDRGVFWGGDCSCVRETLWDGRTNVSRRLLHPLLPDEAEKADAPFNGRFYFRTIQDIAPSHDGRRLLTARGRSAIFWDADAVTSLKTFRFSSPISRVALSSDAGKALVVDSRGEVSLWDTETGKRIARFRIRENITAAMLVGTGPSILLATTRAPLAVYDVTGRIVRAFGEPTSGTSLVRLSKDERHLSVRSDTGFYRIEFDTGRVVMAFPAGESEGVTDLSPDGKWVVEAHYDGLHVRQVASGDEALTLASFDDGSWAVTDAHGRYDAADPNKSVGLHWVADNDIVELNQLFKDRFYTPHLLDRALRGERLPDVGGRLSEISLPPELDIETPAPNATQLSVRLVDRGGGVGSVTAKVNGTELPQALTPTEASRRGEPLKIDLKDAVWSADGRNTVEIVARTTDGVTRRSGRATVTRVPSQSGPSQLGLYALVVGTHTFAGPAIQPLTYPAIDAERFASALMAGAARLNTPISLKLLTTKAASESDRPTKKNIMAALAYIGTKATSSDTVLLFFAGHGVAHDKQYFYPTEDAQTLQLADDLLLARNTISSRELKEWLQTKVKATRKVIILDTCASGAAASDLGASTASRQESYDEIKAQEDLKDGTGTFVLAGSAADRWAYESSRYGQGLLTYALLSGLHGEAAFNGERLDVLNWFTYARRAVTDLAKGEAIKQVPTMSLPDDVVPFPIALMSVAERQAIPLQTLKPRVLQAQVFSVNGADHPVQRVLRARLRQVSDPIVAENGVTPIVYLDRQSTDLPDALAPRIQYVSADNEGLKFIVRLFLGESENPAFEQPVTVPTDLENAARRLTQLIVDAAIGLK